MSLRDSYPTPESVPGLAACSRAFLESVCFPLFLPTLSTFVQDSVLSLEFGQ